MNEHQQGPDHDEEMTSWDIAGWHLINCVIAAFIAAVVFLLSNDSWVAATGAFILWVIFSLWLARIGFWDWLEGAAGTFFTIIFWPFTILFWPLAILFKFVELLFVGAANIVLFLGVLIIYLFVIVGIAGLLWFGVQQLF